MVNSAAAWGEQQALAAAEPQQQAATQVPLCGRGRPLRCVRAWSWLQPFCHRLVVFQDDQAHGMLARRRREA